MDVQQPTVMVSEWEEPSNPRICINNLIPDTEQVFRPRVEVIIQSSANDRNIFFRQNLDGLEAAAMFERVETEVEKVIAIKSLTKTYKIKLEYQIGKKPISKRFCDKDSFDNALREASKSGSTNIKITASLEPPPRSTRSRERGYQILTWQRIEKTTGKYIVPQAAFNEFLDQKLLRNICEEDPALRSLLHDCPSFLQDLQQGGTCGLKLLAIFILAQVSDLGAMFREFWECELLDHRLPFTRSNQPKFCEKQFWQSICDAQWQVLPIELAQLRPGQSPAQFDKDRCLPFKESEKPLGTGGFGVVVKIELDTDHPELYIAEDEHVSHIKDLAVLKSLIANDVLGQYSG